MDDETSTFVSTSTRVFGMSLAVELPHDVIHTHTHTHTHTHIHTQARAHTDRRCTRWELSSNCLHSAQEIQDPRMDSRNGSRRNCSIQLQPFDPFFVCFFFGRTVYTLQNFPSRLFGHARFKFTDAREFNRPEQLGFCSGLKTETKGLRSPQTAPGNLGETIALTHSPGSISHFSHGTKNIQNLCLVDIFARKQKQRLRRCAIFVSKSAPPFLLAPTARRPRPPTSSRTRCLRVKLFNYNQLTRERG